MRDQQEPNLPPDLTVLLDAIRAEFNAKISSLKAWGVAMTLGGGAVGGFVGELVRPGSVQQAMGILPWM